MTESKPVKKGKYAPSPFADPAREAGFPEVTKGIFGELFKGRNKRKHRDRSAKD